MKNSKILPFGDWFKVYERAGNNFNKTQRLLESQIFEADGATLPGPGQDFKNPTLSVMLSGTKYQKKVTAALEWLNENRRVDYVAKAIDAVKKIKVIDDKFYMGSFVGTSETNILAAFIAARSLKSGKKVKDVCKIELRNFEITRDSELDVALTPGERSGTVKTVGKVRPNGITVTNEGESIESRYSDLKHYINAFNLAHYAGGGRDEYNKDSIKDGYFDLEVADGSPVFGNFPLYLGGTYDRATAAREEETTETEEGAVAGASGQADIQFEVGKSEIKQTEASKIETLANIIIESFEGKTVDSFELKASASPEYGAIKNETGWESNYTATSGTGDPGVGTDDATKNCKLAYDRGVAFMNALNAKLNEMGHPGFASFVINWQIASEGGPSGNGRFVDLQLESNGKKPKIVKTTSVTGKELTAAKTTSGSENAILYYYNVSFI